MCIDKRFIALLMRASWDWSERPSISLFRLILAPLHFGGDFILILISVIFSRRSPLEYEFVAAGGRVCFVCSRFDFGDEESIFGSMFTPVARGNATTRVCRSALFDKRTPDDTPQGANQFVVIVHWRIAQRDELATRPNFHQRRSFAAIGFPLSPPRLYRIRLLRESRDRVQPQSANTKRLPRVAPE